MLNVWSGLVVWALAAFACVAAPQALIVVGAPGEEEFGELFDHWGQQWKEACDKAGTQPTLIGGTTNDFELLRTNIAAATANQTDELWLVLIGHGTFDGKEPRFNLRGPDLTATDLTEWLK